MPGKSSFLLKWAGGKGQLLSQLTALLPAEHGQGTYHEPFMGGGALFFSLRPAAAHLSDINADLVAMYSVVRKKPALLIAELAALAPAKQRQDYLSFRKIWNEERTNLDEVRRAALFIYLNRRGFNGLWRVNSKGMFNVPPGRRADGTLAPTLVDPDQVVQASLALQAAELSTGPFDEVLSRAKAGDFVYFDPPYVPLSVTASFTGYAKEGFGLADQERLASVYAALDKRGCKVMLSNSDTPLIRDLYRDYELTQVSAGRSINSNPAGRGKIHEVVVCNYEPRKIAKGDIVASTAAVSGVAAAT